MGVRNYSNEGNANFNKSLYKLRTIVYNEHISPFTVKCFLSFSYGLYLSFYSQTSMVEWAYYFQLKFNSCQKDLNNFFCKYYIFVHYQDFWWAKMHISLWINASTMTFAVLDLLK